MNNDLEIKTNNLPEQSMSSLAIIQNEREALINAYDDVIGLKITEENLKTFKELRLQIRDNRTKGIEPWHTTNKAVSLAIGRTIDAIKNREVEINKRMEAKLLGAEKHFENLEKERVEKLNKERIELVRPYLDEVEHLYLADYDEDMFAVYLETKKRNFKAIQEAEAKAEKERLEKEESKKIHQARKESILPYWEFVPLENKEDDFSKLTNDEWVERFNFIKTEKENKDESIRLQEIEIKKLKKESEKLKEKEAEKKKQHELRAKDLQSYIVFIRDYNGLISKPESEYQKEFSDIKKEAELQWEFDRKEAVKNHAKEEKQRKEKDKQDAILKKEREAKTKLQAELKAKLEAEEKAEELKLQLEGDARLKAEQLAKAPIKEKHTLWVNNFEIPLPQEPNEVTLEISKKFKSFKKWALSEVDKY